MIHPVLIYISRNYGVRKITSLSHIKKLILAQRKDSNSVKRYSHIQVGYSTTFIISRKIWRIKIETIGKYDADTRRCRSQIRFQYRSRVQAH